LPHPGTDAPNFVKESGLLFTQVQPSWIELWTRNIDIRQKTGLDEWSISR
jgi:hypothetical protein